MQKINYELEMERVLASLAPNQVPTLLLHSCCAPCSSAVLERLSDFFEITVDYYNPNIAPAAEYHHRAAEQKRLLHELSPRHPLHFIEGVYEPEVFFALAAGLEDCPEGGERCRRCYTLRLQEAAITAQRGGYNYFSTTLSISPLKDAAVLNEIGKALGATYGVQYLVSDFKKKEGYKRSILLAREHGLYRQDYCGCSYSKAAREARKK